MSYVLQDPAAVLNYSHDWVTEGWLAVGDSIASRVWTITPLATLVGATGDVVFVSDLQLGERYELTEHVVTAAGVEDDRTIVIACEHT